MPCTDESVVSIVVPAVVVVCLAALRSVMTCQLQVARNEVECIALAQEIAKCNPKQELVRHARLTRRQIAVQKSSEQLRASAGASPRTTAVSYGVQPLVVLLTVALFWGSSGVSVPRWWAWPLASRDAATGTHSIGVLMWMLVCHVVVTTVSPGVHRLLALTVCRPADPSVVASMATPAVSR